MHTLVVLQYTSLQKYTKSAIIRIQNVYNIIGGDIVYEMQERMLACNYCGSLNVFRHAHYKGRCVDCGKLYARFKKAQRRGVKSELLLCGDRLMQRGRHASVELQKTFYPHIAEVLNSIKEEQTVEIAHKICKQCGRNLPIEEFRKYVPRGNGIYNTTQGRHTLCKNCEKISARAAAALNKNDVEAIEMLREHYTLLQAHGLPPVTAPARKLLGVDDKPKADKHSDLASLLGATQAAVSGGESEIDRHCRLVRQRGYASAEEADAAHRRLADALRAHDQGVYEEITELVDEWYMEG